MPITNHYDLDIDTTLGGNNASDYVIPSQKAIKVYVDNSTGGYVMWGNITGNLSNQTDLQNALDDKYDASNPSGFITGITSSDVTTALGYTPYNSSNPNGYTSVVESTVSGWGFTKNAGTVTSVNNVSPVNGNVSLTIPTVNNATLTIQKNGTTVNTFTANASTDVTANITVPTKTSDLTNDDGFITGITSTDVTTALGYTPYNSSNPNGYTSVIESTVSGWGFTKNTGTVTSVNNVSPVNGNVTLSIPTDTSDLTNGAGYITGITSGDVTTALGYTPLSNVTKYGSSLSYSSNVLQLLDQDGNNLGSSVTIQSSPDIDGISITTNSDDELQTVGVIDQNNTTNAVKTWTGTKAQYDAIVTKDANTLYNITDDTDVTLTLLELLYPVGSIYIGTMANCPLATLGVGTWVLVKTGIVTAGDIPCKGTGMTLGLTDGTNNGGLYISGASTGYTLFTNNYGDNIGSAWGSTTYHSDKTLGITTDATKSGIIGDTSNLIISCNIWERTA